LGELFVRFELNDHEEEIDRYYCLETDTIQKMIIIIKMRIIIVNYHESKLLSQIQDNWSSEY